MRIYTPATALSLAAVLAAGCGKKDKDATDTDDRDQTDDTVVDVFEGLGYWFVEMEPNEDRDVSSFECDENFTNGNCNESTSQQDTAWTYTGSSEASPGASVAQILKGKDGKYYLYWEGRVFPGEKTSGGDDGDTDANLRASSAEFEFGWWGSSTSESGQEHVSGYTYDFSEAGGGGFNFKLTLDLDAGTVEGDFDMSSERTREWTESDEWEAQAKGTYGSIPSTSFMQQDGGEGYVYNTRDSDDCSGNTCKITITEKSRSAYTITGSFLADDEGQGIDDDIEGLGWDDGVPSF